MAQRFLEIAREFQQRQEVELLCRVICVCNPTPGPASLAPKHQSCVQCGEIWRCKECDGCRGCRDSIRTTLGDSVQTREQEAIAKLLTRLRQGHDWLAETHLRLIEEREVYEGMERRFLAALDTWDLLDQDLRVLFGYPGCVMPEGYCPEASPVSCRACGESGR